MSLGSGTTWTSEISKRLDLQNAQSKGRVAAWDIRYGTLEGSRPAFSSAGTRALEGPFGCRRSRQPRNGEQGKVCFHHTYVHISVGMYMYVYLYMSIPVYG